MVTASRASTGDEHLASVGVEAEALGRKGDRQAREYCAGGRIHRNDLPLLPCAREQRASIGAKAQGANLRVRGRGSRGLERIGVEEQHLLLRGDAGCGLRLRDIHAAGLGGKLYASGDLAGGEIHVEEAASIGRHDQPGLRARSGDHLRGPRGQTDGSEWLGARKIERVDGRAVGADGEQAVAGVDQLHRWRGQLDFARPAEIGEVDDGDGSFPRERHIYEAGIGRGAFAGAGGGEC